MVDCKNYRCQDSTEEEWCRAGADTLLCAYGRQCPYYEKCENETELEERNYPDN